MKQIFHSAESRGLADHGWLKSRHTFSFAGYFNPDRVHFGALRVLNDDIVTGGMGFGAHPHDNMEIISIPLKGKLAHRDNMGTSSIIEYGDIQVMSAGTGVEHSEYNASEVDEVHFLQIWMFPNQRNVEPRYDQISLKVEDRKNIFQQILSPNSNDEVVWVHQDAWFHISEFESEFKQMYQMKKVGNGLYIFCLSGQIKVGDKVLNARDGYGIWEVDSIQVEAISNAEFLLMEVPMNLNY